MSGTILDLAIKLRQMQSQYMYLQNYTHNTSYAHRAYMQVEEVENEKRYIRWQISKENNKKGNSDMKC